MDTSTTTPSRHPGSIDHLIDLLYVAATDAERWPDLLKSVAVHFDGIGSDILHFDIEDRRFSMHVRYGFDHLPPSIVARFQELAPEDPRTIPLRGRFGTDIFAGVQHCRMLITEDVLHASRIYKEALAPAGIEYTMAAQVIQEGRLTGLGVMRGASGPTFTDRDCAELNRLVPHLQRVIAIQRRLAELDFAARHSLDALDKVPTGIVVVDAALGLRTVNAAAQRLLDRQDGLLSRDGRLVVEDRRAHAAIKAAVAGAIDGARGGLAPPERLFAVHGTRTGSTLSIRLGSLWGNRLRYGLAPLAEPMAVLFVADPSEPIRPSPAAVRAFFGLTEAEAGVVVAIASGATLKVAAKELGRSVETCRTQLKAVFLKTGTARQTDLVRLVLSTPAWVDP